MKLVMDEKLKHRLVGVCVIVSLGAIFLPAMMKKSSQRLENNFSVNVQLPPKPVAPDVAVTNQQQMFKTIKVAKVNLPKIVDEQPVVSGAHNALASAPMDEDEGSSFAKTESKPLDKSIELAVNESAKASVKKEIKVAAAQPLKPVKVAVNTVKAKVATTPKPIVAKNAKANTKPMAVKKEIYAVQLASFSKLSNAETLISKLKLKGYKANYIPTTTRNGVIYKVYVGHSPVKNDVVKLRTQLASAMQLNGLVVNTGVS